MENTYIYLDAGYLSKIAEHFFGKGKIPKYDIKQFANTLAKSKGLWCKKAFFYIGEPYQNPTHPSPQDTERRIKHNNFIQVLNGIPDLIVRQGRCQKDDGGKFHQKGVDTLLTMDLCSIKGMKNDKEKIKTIVVLICDTDFVPILNQLKEEHKIKVIVAYYSDFQRESDFSLSNHLWNIADDLILIDKTFFDNSMRK